MNQTIVSNQAPAAIGPYSQAIYSDPFLYVSGQIGLNPQTGEMAGPEFETQTTQALKNMVAILNAAGCGLQDVLSVDVFLVNMDAFADFNRLYETVFDNHRPARAVVAVAGLPKGALVEIKCIARKS